VTYYNFTSDQFTGFHGIVIPGTLHDSLFILEGLREDKHSFNYTYSKLGKNIILGKEAI
jgi:TnpA family transposase